MFAVADEKISQTSVLFKAVTEAKKALKSTPLNPETGIELGNKQYKWTQFGMLEHCLAVVRSILIDKHSFPKACYLRALETNKTVPSIRQACCRSLQLRSDDWNKFSRGNQHSKLLIRDRLLAKDPTEGENILKSLLL
jgi:hypothetical protein